MVKMSQRVFIGLNEISGYNTSLVKGFKKIGVDAHFFDLSDHPFNYENNRVNNLLLKAIRFFGAKSSGSHPKSRLIGRLWTACRLITTFYLFIWALTKFDTFIFTFGRSFFRNYDLPILKYFDKQLIFVYLGSDSRPPFINRKCHDDSLGVTVKNSLAIKESIKKVERYADYIINSPTSGHFHEKKFLQFMKIGIPTYIRVAERKIVSDANDDTIRILHAPSHIEGKGTGEIRKAIDNLKNKGHHIKYVEIINLPNSDVLFELSRCDFVIDELYSDTIMARFAAEAAFFSKPAIVGGYAKGADFGTLTAEETPPVHHCFPEEIESAVEKLIIDIPYRTTLGIRAKEFLDSSWKPEEVAARFHRLIRNDVPADWYFDPADICYLHGWGITEAKARTYLHSYLSACGCSALQLDDKTSLLARFEKFAGLKGDI
jgi:hypothetical protein